MRCTLGSGSLPTRFFTVYPQFIQQFLTTERLPDSYGDDAVRWLLPWIRQLEAAIQARDNPPLLLGINGAQGSGKSTLSRLIVGSMQAAGLRAVCLSLDDFYLGRAERIHLAETVHPLLRTRGVPGTHDVALLRTTLRRLQQATGTEQIPLPQFDKATDDRRPAAECPRHQGPVELLLVEGWFVGVPAQSVEQLAAPLNQLERIEDSTGEWRRFVNERLQCDYEPLFRQLHRLLLLQAPSFEQVYRWRGLQEEKLRQISTPDAAGLMDNQQLQRFIQHYERLTRHGLRCLPELADTVLVLSPAHRITACKQQRRRAGSD